jgi:hypothetical protein
MLVALILVLLALGALALAVYIALWAWRKGRIPRAVMLGIFAFAGYHVYTAVYPPDSFYREEFEERTGIGMPVSAKIIYKNATYPDFHGDYASALLFEVSAEDFARLEALARATPLRDGDAVGGSFWRKAESRYGKTLDPIASGALKKGAIDEHGAWALLSDRKTVYFWFVQT